MGARNRVAIGFFVVPARQVTQAGGIDALESITGLLESLKIPSLSPLSVVMEHGTPQQCHINVIYIRVLRGHCSIYTIVAGKYLL
jgi:hypothetical protein